MCNRRPCCNKCAREQYWTDEFDATLKCYKGSEGATNFNALDTSVFTLSGGNLVMGATAAGQQIVRLAKFLTVPFSIELYLQIASWTPAPSGIGLRIGSRCGWTDFIPVLVLGNVRIEAISELRQYSGAYGTNGTAQTRLAGVPNHVRYRIQVDATTTTHTLWINGVSQTSLSGTAPWGVAKASANTGFNSEDGSLGEVQSRYWFMRALTNPGSISFERIIWSTWNHTTETGPVVFEAP